MLNASPYVLNDKCTLLSQAKKRGTSLACNHLQDVSRGYMVIGKGLCIGNREMIDVECYRSILCQFPQMCFRFIHYEISVDASNIFMLSNKCN